MAFISQSVPVNCLEEQFETLINTLKLNNALQEGAFIQNIPFFTLNFIPRETQIKELFQNPQNIPLYQSLLKNIVPQSETNLPPLNMMTFAQLCLYKVLPCTDRNCPNRPREIVTQNQYKDSEYECPFYHHEKDRRRIVINNTVEGGFDYKANYYEEGRSNADKRDYSQNYFESMFHPLYYKMFKCKREYCKASKSCPFFHQDEEKKTWDKTFNTYLKKDRITYVKDKQKYYETTSSSSDSQRSSEDENSIKLNNYNPKNYSQKYKNNQRNQYQTLNYENNGKKLFEIRKGGERKDSGYTNGYSFGMFNAVQVGPYRM